MVSHSFYLTILYTPQTASCVKRIGLWCLFLKPTLLQAVPVSICFLPNTAWIKMVLKLNHLGNNSSASRVPRGASKPDEPMPLSPGLLASQGIFWTIYATWVHSHLEMVAWAAIVLPHDSFLYLTHPPSHITSKDRWHFIGIFDYCYSHLNFLDGGLWSKWNTHWSGDRL